MVAANPIVKVVMGGKIGTTDTWSCGFAFQLSGGPPSVADMNGIAAGFSTLWATDVWDHASGWKANVGSNTDWSKCTTYYYPASSPTAALTGTVALTPDPGTASTGYLPPQVALVVSLHTGLAGRRNSGRVYMPAPYSVGSNGQIGSAVLSGLGGFVATWLTHCNAATVGALSFNACIGTGSTPHITSTTVDSVFDTQRNRRSKMVAASKVVSTV